jgi:hypothetical protein
MHVIDSVAIQSEPPYRVSSIRAANICLERIQRTASFANIPYFGMHRHCFAHPEVTTNIRRK